MEALLILDCQASHYISKMEKKNLVIHTVKCNAWKSLVSVYETNLWILKEWKHKYSQQTAEPLFISQVLNRLVLNLFLFWKKKK